MPERHFLSKSEDILVVKKLNVCILFGGMSPEHAVSLRSAESVLNNLNPEKYNIIPVGITREGRWLHYSSTDYSLLPGGAWEEHPDNCPAAISPVWGQGLLRFEEDGVKGYLEFGVYKVWLVVESSEDESIVPRAYLFAFYDNN
mgnify:CR=1 FL=1